MKEFKIVIAFLICMQFIQAQQPNDCVNFIQICGNQDINLDVNGYGVQEINSSNACQSQEHNSLWVRFSIETGGTLGFVLTPGSSAITEDYDFWIFGPTSSCNNLGSAIRCSTTNPVNANLTYNTTGMIGSENDSSEGPGASGNSFVKWLNVQANETYFLVIDRPIGNSDFHLEWNGTAIIKNPFQELTTPFNEFEPISVCDDDNDGTVNFNFHSLDSHFLNGNTGFTITYHYNIEDANIRANPINAGSNLSSGAYFARVTDDETECFEIYEIPLETGGLTVQDSEYSYCDDDGDGTVSLNFASYSFQVNANGDYTTTFYMNENDAENAINPISSNQNVSVGTHTYYVRADEDGNICAGVGMLTITVDAPIEVANKSMEICGDENRQLTVNLQDYISEITSSTNYNQFLFYHSLSDAQNQTNAITNWSNYTLHNEEQIYFYLANNNCLAIAYIDFTLSITPSVQDVSVSFCDEDNDGNVNVNLNDLDYQKAPETGVNLSFFNSLSEAQNNQNPIDPNLNLGPNTYTFYARAIVDSEACLDFATISVIIESPIELEPFEEELCDEDNNGSVLVDLSEYIDEVALSQNFSNVEYYLSQGDAESQTGAISNLQNYTIENGMIIYYRFNNSNCVNYTTVSFTISPQPYIENVEMDVCDTSGNGQVAVNLSTELNYEIAPEGIDYMLSYYASLNDAEMAVNAISPQVTAQSGDNIYYVRVVFESELCYDIATVRIGIQLPIGIQEISPFEYCDDDYDGLLIVDLSSYIQDVVTTSNYTGFSFYHSEQDALNEENEIMNFQNYAVENGEEVFIKIFNESCYAMTSIDFTIFPKPNLGEDEVIEYCPEQAPIQLAVAEGYSSYTWSHSDENVSSVLVEEPGTYKVEVENEYGCKDEKTFVLQYLPFPFITEVDVEDENATIIGGGERPLYYSIDGGENWQTINEFYNLEAGIYYAQIKREEGCISEGFLFIVLNIPNTFTPNGDGVNDTWNIPYLEAFGGAQMIIYDRYGKKVYDKTVEELFQWDGRYLGRPLPTTTYWYQIITPFQRNLQGWVFLKNRNND